MSHPSSLLTDPHVVLAGLADLLAAGAPLTAALDELVAGLGLRGAMVRDASGGLLAVGGAVPFAVRAERSVPPATLELPVPDCAGGAAGTLIVIGDHPVHLRVLRAVASVVGLALARRPAAAVTDVVVAAEHDLDDLADALHDGPVQALVAARYLADAAVRGGDAGAARAAVQEALVQLRLFLWHLRPRTDGGLGPALSALSARVSDGGGSALVLAGAPGRGDALRGPAAGAAYRLVQAVVRPGTSACLVSTDVDAGSLVVHVDGGAALSRPDRWARRARALGGDLLSSPGRLRLTLPLTEPRNLL